MRTAVNYYDQRAFRSGRHAQRLGNKSLDRQPVVVAEKGKGLDVGNLFIPQNAGIQVCELPRRSRPLFPIELSQIGWPSKCVSDLTSCRYRPASDRPPPANNHCGWSTLN